MIIRIMVVDPSPRNTIDDIIIYQVPEQSRQEELLTELLDKEGLEWTKIEGTPFKKLERVYVQHEDEYWSVPRETWTIIKKEHKEGRFIDMGQYADARLLKSKPRCRVSEIRRL